MKAITEEELTRRLGAIETTAPSCSPFFRLFAWSGLRIGEAIELRWQDIDVGERIVNVRRRYHAGNVGPPKSRYGKRACG